eukprot:3855082-Rhodomonas_salina.2
MLTGCSRQCCVIADRNRSEIQRSRRARACAECSLVSHASAAYLQIETEAKSKEFAVACGQNPTVLVPGQVCPILCSIQTGQPGKVDCRTLFWGPSEGGLLPDLPALPSAPVPVLPFSESVTVPCRAGAVSFWQGKQLLCLESTLHSRSRLRFSQRRPLFKLDVTVGQASAADMFWQYSPGKQSIHAVDPSTEMFQLRPR